MRDTFAVRDRRAPSGRIEGAVTSPGSTGRCPPPSPPTASGFFFRDREREEDAGYSVYVRGTDGSPAVRLGEGSSQDLSAGRRVGAGDRSLRLGPAARGLPDGRRRTEGPSRRKASGRNGGLHAGRQADSSRRRANRDIGAADLPAEHRRRETAGRDAGRLPGRDRELGRRWAVVEGPDRKTYLYPLAGGEPKEIPGLDQEDRP